MSAAQHMNVAMMTSGGLAPCLSSSVAYLIEFWASALKEGKISGLTIRMYIDGYKGVLTGDSTVIAPEIYDECSCLHDLGGSPIGNSRVKVSKTTKIQRLFYLFIIIFRVPCTSFLFHFCSLQIDLPLLYKLFAYSLVHHTISPSEHQCDCQHTNTQHI